MKSKKRKWKNFEITKVKLNPEQAILSCCDQADSARGGRSSGMQCNLCGQGDHHEAVDS